MFLIIGCIKLCLLQTAWFVTFPHRLVLSSAVRMNTNSKIKIKLRMTKKDIKTLFQCLCTSHLLRHVHLFDYNMTSVCTTSHLSVHGLSFGGKIVLRHTSTRPPVTPLLTLPLSSLSPLLSSSCCQSLAITIPRVHITLWRPRVFTSR